MQAIRGMLLPIPTVFEEDGRIDVKLMEELTDYYVNSGVNALFVGGSFGQGPAMSLEERKQLSDVVCKRVKGRIPVVVHAGTADHFTTIELGKHALHAGAEALAFVGPYYYADHTPEEVRDHFREVGKALKAPFMLYNNPKYQGYPIGAQLMRQMRDDSPQIFGAKLAMGGLDEAVNYNRIVGADFKLFSLASTLFPGMLCGITGTVSPPLAVFPELGVELVRAIDRKDYTRALELQQAVVDFHSAFLLPTVLKECGRTIYKQGLIELGFKVKRYPRWPAGEMPAERKEWLQGLFRQARSVLTKKAA
jgi:dihydrodipicolinate synthase/N-acetylneuraminate lyase